MLNKNNIKVLLSKMTDDMNSNLKKIKSAFGSLEYTDDENQSILHILVDDKYDEEKCFLAIKSLLQIGLSPNLESDYNYNFIQTALYAGYSEKFILNIINEALKYNLNINHVDSDKDTIMHTAIYSDDYSGEVESIYDLISSNGFNSSLRDHEGRTLLEAMIFQKQYSQLQIDSFKKKFEERCTSLKKESTDCEDNIDSKIDLSTKQENIVNSMVKVVSEKDILELEKYGIVLNKKNYMAEPIIGRDKELRNLMITLALEKKNPLIVGESGVGKTALVDELVYKIKTGNVPHFLKEKIILEINPSDIVAGCQYVGMFEDNMTKLMKVCERLDVIVFIDEIHTIYGIGAAKGKENDMASMLKHYIDRSNLKVIGTTTEKEYNDFFSEDALKRRFEKITIKEPDDELLYQIINKVIFDYCIKNGLSLESNTLINQIVDIIVDATGKNHRVYSDIVNNPDLAISIIDKAFAFAKVYDSKFIATKHFIESFEYCDRIYEPTRNVAITRLKSLNINEEKPKQKILKVDFNKFKK